MGDIAKLERIQHRGTSSSRNCVTAAPIIDSTSMASLPSNNKIWEASTLEPLSTYLKGFNNVSPVSSVDRDDDNRTQNKGAKIVEKRLATTIEEPSFQIAISCKGKYTSGGGRRWIRGFVQTRTRQTLGVGWVVEASWCQISRLFGLVACVGKGSLCQTTAGCCPIGTCEP